MSTDKEIINRLFKIVAKQQAAITKLAQQAQQPGANARDMRATVQADVIDSLYGKGTKLVPGKEYAQVHYAKVQPGTAGNTLVVGLTVPANAQAKWNNMKNSLAGVLQAKYSSLLGSPVSAIEWRE